MGILEVGYDKLRWQILLGREPCRLEIIDNLFNHVESLFITDQWFINDDGDDDGFDDDGDDNNDDDDCEDLISWGPSFQASELPITKHSPCLLTKYLNENLWLFGKISHWTETFTKGGILFLFLNVVAAKRI